MSTLNDTFTRTLVSTQTAIVAGTEWLDKTLDKSLGMTALPKSPLQVQGKTIDPVLLLATLALLAIGLVMVGSASIDYAAKQVHDPFYFTKRHALYIILGSGILFGNLSVPLKFWQKHSLYFLLLGIALLMLVLIPHVGRRVNGSQRWISLGVFTLQVSEFVKVFLMFYLADYFVRFDKDISGSFKPFIKPLGVLSVIGILLLLEPDFGSTVVIMMAALAVMFVAGIPLLRFLIMMFGTLLLGVLAVWLEPYRMKRFTTFVDPWADDVNLKADIN